MIAKMIAKNGVKNVPYHLAIVPDGNRRWAMNHRLKPWTGHKQGEKNFKEILRAAFDMGVVYFSIWAMSKDNFQKRSPNEVRFLLNLFKKNFQELINNEDVHKIKIKINVIGWWKELFPEEIVEIIQKAIEATRNYQNHFLNLFLAYSGTEDILRAVEKTSLKIKSGIKISSNLFKENLLTREFPPVDFLIRTGGDPHLSDGFMMWDTANAQLYFSDKLWPDFNLKDFKKAIKDYSQRQRRFGK